MGVAGAESLCGLLHRRCKPMGLAVVTLWQGLPPLRLGGRDGRLTILRLQLRRAFAVAHADGLLMSDDERLSFRKNGSIY